MARRVLLFDNKGNPQLRLGDGKTIPLKTNRPEINGRIVLLIDCSGSMSGSKLQQAKKGVVSFSDKASEDNNQVGLVSFDSEVHYHAEPTSNLESLRSAVNSLETTGTTNMSDGIAFAARVLGGEGPRTIVMVSDGMPDSPEEALEEARKAKAQGIDIICIGVDDADLDFLKQIASIEKMAQKVTSENQGLQNALTTSVGLLRLKGKK